MNGGRKTRRVLTFSVLVASHLACVGLGVGITCHAMRHVLEATTDEVMALAFSSRHLEQQVAGGTPKHARQAALAHLKLLDKYRFRVDPALLYSERRATLLQLATLEERLGDKKEALQHLWQAYFDCREVPQIDCQDSLAKRIAALESGTTMSAGQR